jgi:superfamily II DNA or RNA helicase
LYQWQRDAFNAWAKAGYRGVVEAVTGAGKTRLALEAIRQRIRVGGRCAVIVPTVALQDQWVQVLQQLENVTVGRLGGGRAYQPRDIVVAVVNSASARFADQAFVQEMLGDGEGLIVLDECHRYGADWFQRALSDGFRYRLGLTATYERTDDGLKDYVTPYLGRIVFRLDYHRALAEQVISRFKVAFLGVAFTGTERKEYDQRLRQERKAYRELRGSGQVRLNPFGTFLKDVQRINKNRKEYGHLSRVAGRYLQARAACLRITANAEAKQSVVQSLAPAMHNAHRSILFTSTQESAHTTRESLEDQGLSAAAVDAATPQASRRRVMIEFAEGGIDALCAPRILDEGINVPECDLGVVITASRSRRQMIQRMGRILRPKDDGRLARLVVLYVVDTLEDPDYGAHENFLEDIVGAADDVRHFLIPEEAVVFLNAWEPNSPGGPPDRSSTVVGGVSATSQAATRTSAASLAAAAHAVSAADLCDDTIFRTMAALWDQLLPEGHQLIVTEWSRAGVTTKVPTADSIANQACHLVWTRCGLAPGAVDSLTAADWRRMVTAWAVFLRWVTRSDTSDRRGQGEGPSGTTKTMRVDSTG